MTADFAANSLIYLGVLLSVVVIFVFFAFGYFGEAVKTPSLRSPIFVAAPLIFFGLAWMLRNKTGVPAAANAVGLIGALILPVMLAALTQDGANWGNREGIGTWFPLAWVPNLEGEDRWVGYAIVGVVCAAFYFVLAIRHSIYAYGVAPALWAVIGAVGLYWASGMSGPQMLAVLAAISVGLVAATLGRRTFVGRIISVATVRIGSAGALVVFGFALLFAYNDAIEGGTAAPSLADLASPGAAAAALLAGVLAVSSGTGFAWEGLGERTRASLSAGLRVAAYIAAGVALVLSLSYETTPGWIGAVLVGYGLVAAVIDRLIGGTGEAVSWIARGSIAVGAALSITDPAATTVVWSGIAIVAMARAVVPVAREYTATLVPYPGALVPRVAELWIPLFIVVGAGVSRIVGVVNVPVVLLIAAVAAVLTRLVPPRLDALKSIASFPAVVFGLAAAATAAVIQWDRDPYSLTEVGLGLGVLALVSATVAFPWTWRLPAVIVTADGAMIAIAVDALEADAAGVSMIATVVLSATGVLLVVASFVEPLRRWAIPHGLYAHLALYGAIAVSLVSEEAALVALSVAVVVHGIEAFLIDREMLPFTERLVESNPTFAPIRDVPALFAVVGITPLVIIAASRIEWSRLESEHLAVPLSTLALGYGVGALLAHRQPLRDVLIALGYVCAGGAVVVAVPDGAMLVVGLASAAVVTFLLAVAMQLAVASNLSWALAFGAVVVGGSEAGLAEDHLYRPLLGLAIAVVAVSTSAAMLLRRRADLRSWFLSAGAVGVLAVGVGMAGAVIDDRWLWAWAIAAAASTLGFVLVYHAGLLVSVVWAYLLIAYVDVFGDSIRSNAVWLLPFVAALVAVSAILPGRRSWDVVRDAAPLTALSALVVMAGAIALAVDQGDPGATLAWSALILAGLTVIRTEDAWLHAGGLLLITAGAWELGPWLTASLATVAMTETLLAELRRDEEQGRVLPWVSVTLWGATFAAAAEWLELEAIFVVLAALASGAVLSAVALGGWLRWPEARWIDRWVLPMAALGQGGLIGAGLQATVAFGESGAAFAWAAVAGIEAVLVGLPGTVKRITPAVWVSTTLVGIAAGLTLWGLDLTDATMVFTLLGVGMALSVAALTLWLTHHRVTWIDPWVLPMVALGQVGLIGAGLQGGVAFGESGATLVWAGITGFDAVLVGVPATHRHSPIGVWLSASMAGLGIGLLMRGLELPDPAVVFTLLALGSVASAGALGRWLTRHETTPIDLWVLPVAVLGQVSFIGSGLWASWAFDELAATLVWAVIAWIEAVVVGVPATIQRSQVAVWVSGFLIGGAAALTLRGLQLEWIEVVWTTGILAITLLTVWLVAVVGTENDRIVLWQMPVALLAQAAIVTSGVAAMTAFGTTGAYLTWMVLAAIDMLAIGVVATATASRWMAFVSAALSVAVVGLGIGWQQLGPGQVGIWFGAMAVAGVGATAFTRFSTGRTHVEMWVWPAHTAAIGFGAICVASALNVLATRDANLVGSAVALCAGTYLLANRGWFAEQKIDMDWPASLAFVVSGGLLTASLTSEDPWAVATLIGISLVGGIAAGFGGATREGPRTMWLIVAVGLCVVGAVGAIVLFGPLSAELGWILIVNGGAFAAFAVTARQIAALHLAVLTWLAAALILIEHRWSLELHATVLSVSVVLLVMIEIERYRRRRESLDVPDWLRIAEWVVMLAPLVLAGRAMVTRSLAFGLLLGAEGLALLVWGTLSRVRRRAMLGLTAITAAVIMAVMIPLVRGIEQNLTGGQWLVIGGVAAVVFITTGSLIEKYRTRIGIQITQWGEILEAWE